MSIWQLIKTPRVSGSENMRNDLRLFSDFEAGSIPSTLKIYSWQPQCISLGYSQKKDEEIDAQKALSFGWDIVRRPTGGGIVFHNEAEVTYSLVTAIDNPLLPKGLVPSYKAISQAIVCGLSLLDIKAQIRAQNTEHRTQNTGLCFSYPAEYEIVVDGKKIVGSAQKRGKKAMLQQGSIFVRRTEEKDLAVLKGVVKEVEAISVEEVLGRTIGFDELSEALVNGFREVLRIGFAALLFLGILNFGFPAGAATWLDPSLKWKTIETPHFSIHYYTQIEDIAKKFAPMAEEEHAELSKFLKHEVNIKTQVILLDNTDYGNGYAAVYPYPCITLYLTDLSNNLNPYKYSDYLRYLFIHEYTHILYLDIADNWFALLRFIAGRLIYPNTLSPAFLNEGMSTYMETRFTNAGRGRDPRWDMMLRMDFLEKNLKTIDQASATTIQWPAGNTSYLYGVEFLQYLAEKYGEEKLATLSHQFGDHILLGVDGVFFALYGKSVYQLWDEWQKFSQVKYQSQKDLLGDLTPPQALTRNGYIHAKPKWSKDGRFIYFLRSDVDYYPQIQRLELSSGKTEKVLEELVLEESLSFSPDGKNLLYAAGDIYKGYYSYKDLNLFNLETKKKIRLTNGARVSDPSFSPSGAKIAFVKNDKSISSIWTIDLKKTGTANLFAGSMLTGSTAETEIQYFSPSFSPDEKKLLFSKRSTDGRQGIYLYDLTRDQEKTLILEGVGTSEANPSFSPDGKYVLYDSDRTGIVNLYAYELATGKVFQITNVIGGATMPDISADGKKISYISYSSKGYDVAVMDFDPSGWKETSLPAGKAGMEVGSGKLVTSESYNVHDYKPFTNLWPSYWFPMAFWNENGRQASILVSGQDPLVKNYYSLNFGYDFNAKRPAYTLYYANNQFKPQLSFVFIDSAAQYGWGGQNYWEREKQSDFLVSFYDKRVFCPYDQQIWAFGFRSINLSNLSDISLLNPTPTLGNLNALLFFWQYHNDRKYAASISSEDGVDVKGMVEVYSPTLNSDFAFTNYSLSMKNYFPLPMRHQVLATLLDAFYSRGEQMAQGNLSWKYLSLRGYPNTFLRGNKGASLSFEYRLPLWYPERGLIYGAPFLDRIWMALFLDLGAATFGKVGDASLKRGIGTELNFVNQAFGFYFYLKLGYAKGLDPGGEEKTYFSFSL